MGLYQDQEFISSQVPSPVVNVNDSSKVISESETVQLYYYVSTTRTSDAGVAAGTVVVGQSAYFPIQSVSGDKVGTINDHSLTFTCLALTNEKPFRWDLFDRYKDASEKSIATQLTSGYSNGDFCVDYRRGKIYGVKATTASTMTVFAYKRASVVSTLDVGDIEIGAVELKDGTSDQRVTVDSTGALKVASGSLPDTQYISPADFTVTYTSASTITLTGVPFALASGANVVYIKVRNSSTNVTLTYVNGSAGYAFAHSAGVITAYLNGTATNIFTSNDMYEMGLNAQQKAYDPTTDVTKTINQSPDRSSYVQDSLLDTTNVTAATNYYPSTLGMSMDGFKDMSLTGQLIDADNTTTMTVEVTNDEDTTNANWQQVYGYDSINNTVVNSMAAVSTTKNFAWDFDNFNYSFFRVKIVNGDNTNTMIVKARRKSL